MLQLLKKTVFIILAALSVAACSSSDPEYVDPEAHEKTIQLNEKYGPVLVGTWHFEKIGEMRKCQKRELVTINGEQVYTDWENVELGGWEDEDVKQNGTFSGTWKLRYWDPYGDGKQNYLELSAKYDNKDIDFAAYQYNAVFDYADETTLRFKSYYISGENGWMIFQRGEAEPSF